MKKKNPTYLQKIPQYITYSGCFQSVSFRLKALSLCSYVSDLLPWAILIKIPLKSNIKYWFDMFLALQYTAKKAKAFNFTFDFESSSSSFLAKNSNPTSSFSISSSMVSSSSSSSSSSIFNKLFNIISLIQALVHSYKHTHPSNIFYLYVGTWINGERDISKINYS